MIEKARDLSRENKEILLAYLHFLHMTEHLKYPRPASWAYHNIQAHWVRSKPTAHWVM